MMKTKTSAVAPLSLGDIILIHVRACGPVTFGSIAGWVAEQHAPHLDDYQIAAEMNALARSGLVKLYDDGESWDADLKPARSPMWALGLVVAGFDSDRDSWLPEGIIEQARSVLAEHQAGATCPTSNGADLDRWESLQAQLRTAIEALESVCEWETASGGWEAPCFKQARAAIAKAKGETQSEAEETALLRTAGAGDTSDASEGGGL